MSHKILGIGNPLLDLCCTVPASYLEKYGLEPFNAILAEEKHKPLYKEIEEQFDVEYVAGGATQNSIRAAQWMLQEPGATAYIGCIGKDDFGKKLKEVISATGVTPYYMEVDHVPTGTCAALVTNNDRSLVANLSAANEYKHEHFLQDDIQAIVKGAKLVYMSGFFLTVSSETAVALGKHCAEQNVPFLINLAAPFLLEVPPLLEKVKEILPYADFVFGNEHEGAAVGKALGWDASDLKEVAKNLAAYEKVNKKRNRVALITQGAEPTIVVDGDNAPFESAPTPCPKDELVDLNGAGDSFVGGFISQLVQGKPLNTCLEAGHYCAGVVIRQSGVVIPFDEKPKQF